LLRTTEPLGYLPWGLFLCAALEIAQGRVGRAISAEGNLEPTSSKKEPLEQEGATQAAIGKSGKEIIPEAIENGQARDQAAQMMRVNRWQRQAKTTINRGQGKNSLPSIIRER
jgi:hypothetical protein